MTINFEYDRNILQKEILLRMEYEKLKNKDDISESDKDRMSKIVDELIKFRSVSVYEADSEELISFTLWCYRNMNRLKVAGFTVDVNNDRYNWF